MSDDPPIRPLRRSRLEALGLHRPELRAWALYDWANSGFATTIMAAVLPIYFVRVAASEFRPSTASALWGYTSALGMLIITLISPLLGSMADFMAAKKRFLAGFAAVGVLATALLWFVHSGDWVAASVFFLFGNLGFTGSIVFYDSLLPHIAAEEEVDRVSAGGWAVGYIGGGLLLAVNAFMITSPGTFGFADAGAATRASFLTVAVWWALFTLPLLLRVPEPPRALESDETTGESAWVAGFARLRETFSGVREYPDLLLFLFAFWLYGDGIGTIIKMATAYGTEIGIGEGDLIGALLLTQFVGVPFTFLFGALARRIGPKAGIMVALSGYAVISCAGYFVTEAWHFWILAAAVGTVQGGAQSLSRSVYSTLIPRHKSSEFFGFFGVFEKFSGIVGPLVFGLVTQLTGTGRLGIVAVVVFFLAGMALLSRVDVARGRDAARKTDLDVRPAAALS